MLAFETFEATWSSFLGFIAQDYRQPTRQRIDELCEQMSNEVDQKLAEKLLHDGPWFVTADGATSKGHSLVTIDCTNAQDDVIHLALIDGGYNRLDAVWLKQQLREQLERLPAVAGVSQDTARVCKKAWKELHRDLRAGNPARWRSLAYIDCGEHVSQLVAADMAKEIPWLQDCRFSCLALIFCYHGSKKSFLDLDAFWAGT